MALLRNLLALVVLALSLEVFSAALPTADYSLSQSGPQPGKVCKNPLRRKEWRKLKDYEKKDYIKAVLCLQKLPSKSDPAVVPGARTRYDDFNSVHITHSRGFIEKNGGIHIVGQFLPWHRYFIVSYENALRQECGYKGAHPYWDWTLDAGAGKDIRDSPVFDPVTGFGGDGKPGVPPLPPTDTRGDFPGGSGGGCVLNGPFVNFTLNIGPGDKLVYNPRCISRSINPTMAVYLNYSNVAPLAGASTFKQFDFITEATPYSLSDPLSMTFHGAGHYVIGGEASDIYSNPTRSRFLDIGGPQKPFTSEPQVTLDFPIDLGVAGAPIPISRVMDIMEGNKGGIGCYEYEW